MIRYFIVFVFLDFETQDFGPLLPGDLPSSVAKAVHGPAGQSLR